VPRLPSDFDRTDSGEEELAGCSLKGGGALVESDRCRMLHRNCAPWGTDSSDDGVPALLVSVRNAPEAVAALNGGCDILDIKEPSRGPLGMAGIDEIQAIVATRNAASGSLPVSIALGELHEWSKAASVPRLSTEISFLKFGTSRLSGKGDLLQTFSSFRSWFVGHSGTDGSDGSPWGWIAVAYADWQAAEAPPPHAVAEAALASGCDGVLIDTYSKASGGLFDSLSTLELNEFAAIVRQAGKSLAVAGRLSLDHIEQAIDLGPDIVGVRSAACRDGRRDLEIDAQAVEQFRGAMVKAATRPRAASRSESP